MVQCKLDLNYAKFAKSFKFSWPLSFFVAELLIFSLCFHSFIFRETSWQLIHSFFHSFFEHIFRKISSQVISQVYSQVLEEKFLPVLFTCFFICFFSQVLTFTGFFTGSKFCDFSTKFSPCKIHRFFHRVSVCHRLFHMFFTGFSQVLIQ